MSESSSPSPRAAEPNTAAANGGVGQDSRASRIRSNSLPRRSVKESTASAATCARLRAYRFALPASVTSTSPAPTSCPSTFATPLFARTESYNVSRTNWIFPTIVVSNDTKGWEVDVHPIVYLGRSEKSTHTVLAPILWDFANPKGRTTVGFPIYWRFADTADDSVTQVAANTLYRQKRVPGGLDWEFHLLPVFSYGQSPTGSWANLFFGLLGYDHDGPTTKIKALWLPITVAGGGAAATQGPPPPPPSSLPPEPTEQPPN